MQNILIAKIYPDAKIPMRKNPTDAGLDLYAYTRGMDGNTSSTYIIMPHYFTITHTGIVIDIPSGYCGIIKPKSRHDILVGAGVVDAGYQGEILIKLINPTNYTVTFNHGEAIAQLLIQKIETPVVKEVEFSSIFTAETSRGKTGGIVTQLEDYSEHEQENWKQEDTFERTNHTIP